MHGMAGPAAHMVDGPAARGGEVTHGPAAPGRADGTLAALDRQLVKAGVQVAPAVPLQPLHPPQAREAGFEPQSL